MKLHVEPRVVKSWKQFLEENPKYSIALDGYVYGQPCFEESSPHANFNHHEEVNRFATRSTCAQVYDAIKQDLIDAFRTDGKVEGNIFVNDPDQDTSLAVWLLLNHERITGQKSEPLINRLVFLEDHLDTTAGCYLSLDPFSEVMRQIAWVFEPYTHARESGRVPVMDGLEMRTVIEAVCSRISMHVLGKGGETLPDFRYETIGGGAGWSLVREVGFYARTKMYHDGIKAFASVREHQDGAFTYTVGKMTPFVRFPLVKLYDYLNHAEIIGQNNMDRWGGGDTIGGSPRQAKSRLHPKELERLVNKFLKG